MPLRLEAPLEIGVCVADLERAVGFYETVLGFTRISDATLAPDRAELAGFGPVGFKMARMQTNYGERIKLLEPDPKPRQDPRDAILGRAGISYLTFIVADLDASLARLREAGVEIVTAGGAFQTRPGTRLAFFRDSEGNALELVEYEDLKAYRPDL